MNIAIVAAKIAAIKYCPRGVHSITMISTASFSVAILFVRSIFMMPKIFEGVNSANSYTFEGVNSANSYTYTNVTVHQFFLKKSTVMMSNCRVQYTRAGNGSQL